VLLHAAPFHLALFDPAFPRALTLDLTLLEAFVFAPAFALLLAPDAFFEETGRAALDAADAFERTDRLTGALAFAAARVFAAAATLAPEEETAFAAPLTFARAPNTSLMPLAILSTFGIFSLSSGKAIGGGTSYAETIRTGTWSLSKQVRVISWLMWLAYPPV
jgi:hypothetical protein